MPALLQVDGLSRHFGGVRAVDDVSFAVDEGEIVGLIGPNGAGKTTAFNVITRLYTPDEGRVVFDGNDLLRRPAHRIVGLGIARTFQNVVLFGPMSVLDNVLVGTHSRRWFFKEQAARRDAIDALEYLGLMHLAERPAAGLPYGTLKRIELARALASKPRLLLLDEPTVGLDPLEAQRLRESIAELRGTDVAIVLTSHYLGDIERLAQRVVILQRGQVTLDLPLERLLERAGAAAEVALAGIGPVPSAADLERAAAFDGVRVLGVKEGEPWSVRFEVKDWTPDSLRALATLWPTGEITDVRVHPVSLETVFSELARAEEGLR